MAKRAEWSVGDLKYIQLRPGLEKQIVRLPDGSNATVADLITRDVALRAFDLAIAAMLVSSYKYGAVEDAYPERVHAVAISGKEARAPFRDLPSAEKRMTLYREDGNVERLVDAINFQMIEFMCPRHPKAHFKATDASGSPGRKVDDSSGGGTNQMSNKDLNTIAKG